MTKLNLTSYPAERSDGFLQVSITAGGNPVPIDAAICRDLYEKAHAGQL